MKRFATCPLLFVFALAPTIFAGEALVSRLASPIVDAKDNASERADHVEQALVRAKATGKDIVVFQYGSDWNGASLSLFQNVWNKDPLPRALGPGFILVAVDQPEVIGGRAVYGRCTAEKCGLVGYSDQPVGSAPPLRLETLAKAEPPTNDITAVESDGKAVFTKRADGAFVVKADSPNPAQDILTLALKPARSGSILRFDFPTDTTLPGGGPGRASNGNAVISEVEIWRGQARIEAQCAWANTNSEGRQGPWAAVDGVTDQREECWNMDGDHHVRRTLLVATREPLKSGETLTVKLVCKGQWNQHVPGTMRAAVLADDGLVADVRVVTAAQLLQRKNRGFTFTGWGKVPRLSLLDAQGRPVGADTDLAIGLSPADFASRIKVLRSRREQRDTLWAKADQAQGPAKAELLRQGLDALNIGRDPAFDRFNGWGGKDKGPYESIHRLMKDADPRDESGAIRWLGFGMDGWGAIAWGTDNDWRRLLKDKPNPSDADYAAAEACIDRELADPRNRLLETDHIQHLMMAKYELYLSMAKDNHTDAKVLAILREVAKRDPTTFWGLGAIGYLGMYRRSENPFVVYGWDGNFQLKPGTGAWTLVDAWKQVDHAGTYELRLSHTDGKGGFTVKRVVIIDGDHEIGEAKPTGDGVVNAVQRRLKIAFTCRAFPEGRKPVLRIEYEAQTGQLDTRGDFAIEPVLLED